MCLFINYLYKSYESILFKPLVYYREQKRKLTKNLSWKSSKKSVLSHREDTIGLRKIIGKDYRRYHDVTPLNKFTDKRCDTTLKELFPCHDPGKDIGVSSHWTHLLTTDLPTYLLFTDGSKRYYQSWFWCFLFSSVWM